MFSLLTLSIPRAKTLLQAKLPSDYIPQKTRPNPSYIQQPNESSNLKLYTANDLRDDSLLKMLTRSNIQLTNYTNGKKTHPHCQYCLEIGNQEHFINNCKLFDNTRNHFKTQLNLITNTKDHSFNNITPKDFIINFITLEGELYDFPVRKYILSSIKHFISSISSNFHIVTQF